MLKDYSSLSVIIATYQEEGNIEEALKRCVRSVPGAEIVVVDDSKDKTVEIAERTLRALNVKEWIVHKNEVKKGKGYAMQKGIQLATKPYHAQVDADMQFPPESLPALVKPLFDGEADITFCSRFCKGAAYEEGSMPLLRAWANRAISFYTSCMSSHWLTDIMAGFKAWKADAIKNCAIRCDHFGYEGEIAVMAGKKGYRIVEVPIFYHRRLQGETKVALLKDGCRVGLFLMKTKLCR